MFRPLCTNTIPKTIGSAGLIDLFAVSPMENPFYTREFLKIK
jgi:hypothetical protein